MDIDNELERILKRYPVYPEYEEVKRQDVLKKEVRELIMGLTDCLFIANSPHDVNEIIIKNGLKACDYEVLESIEQLKHNLNEYRQVMFLSYGDHEEWTEKLQNKYHKGVVQDLYVLLLEKGYSFNQEYYENTVNKRDPYADINFLRKELLGCPEKKKMLLMQKLIYVYIQIRDFKNAFLYMDEYIRLQFINSEHMNNLKAALEEMFDTIRNEMLHKKHNSILMCWIDAVQYNEMEEMPFLYSERNNTLCFDNAFTVTPYTIPTYFTLFCQKRCVKDKLYTYKHDIISEKNSKLMALLNKENYLFSRHGIALNIFENENCSYGVLMNDSLEFDTKLRKYNEIKNYKELDCKEDICPVILWKGLRDILLNEKVFTLVHIVAETHTPYICGNYDGDYVNDQFHPNADQIDSARNYVDQQLKFYSNIWGEEIITIIMSDHGKNVSDKKGKMYRDLYHTMLMVKGKEIIKKRCGGMFSYLKFYGLVKYLLHPEQVSLDDLFDDYIQIEDLDKYGLSVITQLINRTGNIEKSGLLGYCAVRTRDSMLVRRNDYKYMYFRFPCLINQYDINYKEEYECLKSLLPDYKTDIEEDFFTYTRIIYLAIRNHDRRVEKLQKKADELLNILFESFTKGDVLALRGGGEATNEIIRRMKDKVDLKYIIDNEITNDVGLPNICYIKECEIKDYPINTIIITSYNFREEMRQGLNELNKPINQYRIIDIYQYFRKNGLELLEDYHADKISVDDMKLAYEKLCG